MESKNSTDPIYTLSVASKLSGVPMHSIRQYVEKGLIIPHRTKGNRNLFSEVDIIRLKCIKHALNEDKINVAGIKALYALIPCWVMKPCTIEERNKCGAYHSINMPCWDASEKSELCKNTDCRTCNVYRFPEKCNNLKDLFKSLLMN